MNRITEAIKRSGVGLSERRDPGTIIGRYRFDDDFLGFSGHFPGYPILPAVVQLTAALCLLEEQKGRHLNLKAVQNAKFLQEIRPGCEISVECKDFSLKEDTASKIQICSGGKTVASFTMTYS